MNSRLITGYAFFGPNYCCNNFNKCGFQGLPKPQESTLVFLACMPDAVLLYIDSVR